MPFLFEFYRFWGVSGRVAFFPFVVVYFLSDEETPWTEKNKKEIWENNSKNLFF